MAVLSAVLLALQAPPPPRSGGWQQEVAYRIAAALDDSAGVLRGHQVLVYRNRSPDTLRALVLHLGLNAFRPSSGWAATARDLWRRAAMGSADRDLGWQRVRAIRVDGSLTEPAWPASPDSTVVRVGLAAGLAPGDSLALALDFEARPPRLAGHRARSGRHFDFSQWHPQVAVYGEAGWQEHPAFPEPVASGEIASFLVELDLAQDQVVAATGVPVCGDPGWEGARRVSRARVTMRRAAFPEPRDPEVRRYLDGSRSCPPAAPGRRTVVWYAEQVPRFALSADPEFRYEEGDVFGRPVRVLYRPGSERTWGAGLASGRAETALVWLDEILGPYPWPELTLVERLEQGGAGMAMLVMSGGAEGSSQDAVLRAVGRSYLDAVPARSRSDGWLEDGLAAFQARWFFESLGRLGDYRRLEREVLDWDLDRLSAPIARPPEAFESGAVWRAMSRSRAELFLHQLRHLVGEAGMRRALRSYFAEHRFRRAGEAEFRAAVEDVAGDSLAPLFRQWLHETTRIDYGIRRARRARQDSVWVTTVAVAAREPGRFPMEVWVYGERDSAMTRLPGLGPEESVTLSTRTRPVEAAVDPAALGHDWNMLNNRRGFGAFGRGRSTEHYLGGWFSQRHRRDRLTRAIAPTAWFNDAGGWTLGARTRDDYLGRFRMNEAWVNVSTGWTGRPRRELNGRVVIRNPTWLALPGADQWLDAALVEGRALLQAGFVKRYPQLLGPPAPVSWGVDLRWLAVRDGGATYLDPREWNDAATVELTGSVAVRRETWRVEAVAAGGRVTAGSAGVARQAFGRVGVTLAGEQGLGALRLRARTHAAAALAGEPLPRQRLIHLAGADPYQRFASPLLRSRGALLARDGINYHEPGGAGIRGLGPGVVARQSYAVNLELERAVGPGTGRGLFRRAALALFLDAALADGDLDPDGGDALRAVADAGIGVRFDHQIGATPFQTRLDLPLWVSRPALAQDTGPTGPIGLRWLFGFRPSW